jgi:hypothetical protein
VTHLGMSERDGQSHLINAFSSCAAQKTTVPLIRTALAESSPGRTRVSAVTSGAGSGSSVRVFRLDLPKSGLFHGPVKGRADSHFLLGEGLG